MADDHTSNYHYQPQVTSTEDGPIEYHYHPRYDNGNTFPPPFGVVGGQTFPKPLSPPGSYSVPAGIPGGIWVFFPGPQTGGDAQVRSSYHPSILQMPGTEARPVVLRHLKGFRGIVQHIKSCIGLAEGKNLQETKLHRQREVFTTFLFVFSCYLHVNHISSNTSFLFESITSNKRFTNTIGT